MLSLDGGWRAIGREINHGWFSNFSEAPPTVYHIE